MTTATTQPSAQSRFQEVCLLKLRKPPLGHGAYGVLYEATCDELHCVAKCFHPHIFGDKEQAREVFERDLQILCGLNHPNLVQYLGIHAEPAADSVTLLMEKLDSSLCQFLHDQHDAPLPFHLEVSICRDIALGLRYLHGNGIRHHNLSSNNVLLLGTLRAKVSDFGLANLCGITQIQARTSNSWAYMPPELLGSVSQATDSVDEFSLGVCMIEVLTRKHPDPGPLMEEVASQKSTETTTFKLVSEVTRRHNHISLIDSNHPMLSIALDSISDNPRSRPSTKVVCRKLQQMKESQECPQDKISPPVYSDWLLIEFDEPTKQRMQDRILHQQQQLEEKEHHLKEMRQVLSLKEQQLNAREQTIIAKETEIDKLSAELVKVEKQVKEGKEKARQPKEDTKANRLLAEKDQKISDLEAKVLRLKALIPPPSPSQAKHFSFSNGSGSPQSHKKESPKTFTTRRWSFSWKRGKPAPVSCQPQSSVAIGHNGKVYITHCNIERSSGQVWEYNQSADTWQVLPIVPKSEFTIVVFEGALVAVGGSRNLRKLNTLLALSSTCIPGQMEPCWLNDFFPNMPTARAFPSCATHGQYLMVAGGEVQGMAVTEVEVLDFRNKRWDMVRRLPQLGNYTRMTTCTTGDYGDNGYTYFLGGFEDGTLTTAAFRCFVPDLVNYTRQRDRVLWKMITPLPVAGATCVAVEDQLLAFGGYEKWSRRQSNAIYSYQPPPLDKWEKLSITLPCGFSRGLVAVTSCGNRRVVVIVGGNTAGGETCFTFTATI